MRRAAESENMIIMAFYDVDECICRVEFKVKGRKLKMASIVPFNCDCHASPPLRHFFGAFHFDFSASMLSIESLHEAQKSKASTFPHLDILFNPIYVAYTSVLNRKPSIAIPRAITARE